MAVCTASAASHMVVLAWLGICSVWQGSKESSCPWSTPFPLFCCVQVEVELPKCLEAESQPGSSAEHAVKSGEGRPLRFSVAGLGMTSACFHLACLSWVVHTGTCVLCRPAFS